MEDFDINNFEKKLQIADAAAQLYTARNGSFTMHEAARGAGLTPGEVFEYFPNQEAIIYFFYSSLITRYRLMIEEIEDFDTFTLSEKLSNFAYASFDMLQEHEPFVEQTFRSHILHSCKKTAYERNVEALIADFFKKDSGKSASSDLFVNSCSLRLIRKKYLHLICFWLNDESENKELTLELTDKVTGLMHEALYTSVVDRSFDLAKFLFSNDVVSQQVPLWKKVSSSFEIR
jgi:transcription-repair coupling factor (superfamily II helicase)